MAISGEHPLASATPVQHSLHRQSASGLSIMSGSEQKTDLGELFPERRIKSQFKGIRTGVALVRRFNCVGGI